MEKRYFPNWFLWTLIGFLAFGLIKLNQWYEGYMNAPFENDAARELYLSQLDQYAAQVPAAGQPVFRSMLRHAKFLTTCPKGVPQWCSGGAQPLVLSVEDRGLSYDVLMCIRHGTEYKPVFETVERGPGFAYYVKGNSDVIEGVPGIGGIRGKDVVDSELANGVRRRTLIAMQDGRLKAPAE